MPGYSLVNLADQASTTAATAGAALTAQFANADTLPGKIQARNVFHWKGQSSAATAKELFIDGITSFRFRTITNSSTYIRFNGVFSSLTVPGNSVNFEGCQGFLNNAGTVTAYANATVVKHPTIATATLAFTISGQDIIVTGTGNAGDTVGLWDIEAIICEVDDAT